jgi:hypothetical protein
VDVASFRDAFFDHELLESMGLHYALNVPLVDGGRTARTMNFLRAMPAFSQDDLNRVRAAAAIDLALVN